VAQVAPPLLGVLKMSKLLEDCPECGQDVHICVCGVQDARKVQAMALRSMARLEEEANTMLANALLNCTPDRCATAVARANELFNVAPHLAGSENEIGGCLNMTYRDLFALYAIADKKHVGIPF
jgi:hypothetical protein